jgi:hypothetical protein
LSVQYDDLAAAFVIAGVGEINFAMPTAGYAYAFVIFEAFLRQFSPTTPKMVDILIATALDLINPKHLKNGFTDCCYCTS